MIENSLIEEENYWDNAALLKNGFIESKKYFFFNIYIIK
jgi:hypothetical protein